MIRLRAWRRASLAVDFEPQTGRVIFLNTDPAALDTTPLSGFASVERSLFGRPVSFAVYRLAEGLFFSAGRHRWPLADPNLSFRHVLLLPCVSRFQVRSRGTAAFSFTYPHLGRFVIGLLDPTYDGIDEDTDFFLKFVAANGSSPSWRSAVERQWIKGGPTSA
jgi:hypothetical protein